MKNIFLITLLLFILSISGIFAQPAWVRKQATPQENTLNDITRVPGTNKLVAVGEGSTVMISEDAGDSWQIITNPAGLDNDFMGIEVAFLDQNVGFICGNYSSILKTIDGGYTWTKVTDISNDEPYEYFNSFDFVSENTGFAVNDAGEVFKTNDRGTTWIVTETGAYFNPIGVCFLDSQNGYLYGILTNQYMVTHDAGQTWDSVGRPQGLPDIYGQTIHYINDSIGFLYGVVGNYGVIFRTHDKGNNWTDVYSYTDMYGCKFANLDNSHILATTGSIDYQTSWLLSDDGGLTWVRNTTYQLPWQCAYSVVGIPPQTYFTVGNSVFGMHKSEDYGNNWISIGKHNLPDVISSSALNDECLYVFGQNTIVQGGIPSTYFGKSLDNGITWNFINMFDYNDGILDNINSDTAFMYATSISSDKNFFKTYNNGKDWEEISNVDIWDPQNMNFFDKNYGFLIGCGLMSTMDGGLTWNEIILDNLDIYPNQADFISADTVVVSGSTISNLSVSYSFDKGNSWQTLLIDYSGYPTALKALNDSLIFVANYNQIFRISIKDNSWQECQVNCDHEFTVKAFDFPSSMIGYAVGDGPFETAFKTTDGGLSWNPMETNTTSALNSVHFIDDEHGFIFGDLGLMLETTTGGVADAKKPDKAVQQIYFTPHPNPFTDQLTLQFETANNAGKSTLVITDLSGKTIKIISIGGNIDRLLLNLPQLSKGVYLLNLYQGNRLLQSEKVVKQ